MRYVVRLAVLLCWVAGLQMAPASAEKRVALVIGNADYKVGPLANPVNDATAVAEAFQKALGFDKVLLRKNLTFDGFRAALMELGREVAGSELGVVYFAGHGTEVAGKNFLIPVDARLAKSGDLGLEAIPLGLVLEQLAGATKLKIVILDACRNNLFPMAGAKRSTSRGLSRIEPEDNTLVVYAAKDGTTADDGTGRRHSPFTQALLKHLATPGLEVSFVFRRVRDDVVAATNPVQTPHVYGTLGGKEFYLKPGQVPAPMPLSAADRMWAAVKDSTSIPALEAFRQRYGKENAVYDRLAEARIENLRKQQTAMLKAEEDRKRAEDERKRAETDLLRPARVFRDCQDICPEMVVLPAGEFTMGSNEHDWEKPPHRVTIQRPFAVGKFEVTFAEWDACVAGGGCKSYPRPSDQGWGRGRRPVTVSWHDAKEYVGWLSRKTGKTYRLLSEGEWEYAARAATATRYAFGDAISKSQAQFNAGQTVEVGSFSPNRFGLHDLHGNVWEWVEDNWHPNYQGAPLDGSVWQGGDVSLRVLRGGSWDGNYRGGIRSAVRLGLPPELRLNSLGFRVSRTL
jgi:formylglycine-generating enzyme required for sulfatase activity